MIAALMVCGALLLLLLVAVVAYHRGRRRGRVTLPANLVAELREHKIRCIGEPPQRVALEIGLLCETAPGADLVVPSFEGVSPRDVQRVFPSPNQPFISRNR